MYVISADSQTNIYTSKQMWKVESNQLATCGRLVKISDLMQFSFCCTFHYVTTTCTDI